MKTALLLLVLGGLLLATALLVLYVMAGLQDVAIGFHGALALGLGILFTVLIGGGLMALVFYSARKGHDDAPTVMREDKD